MSPNANNKMRSLLQGLTSTEQKPTEKEENRRKTTVCASLDFSLTEKAKTLAKIHNVSVSKVIDSALELYINNYEKVYGEIKTTTIPDLPKL